MINNILVSIIVPNYNGAKYIEDCINSVLNQTYTNWELIICDDNSSDNSVELINNYNDDRIISPVIHNENKGAAVARNNAIRQATGEFIAFLDNDDYWDSKKLEKQVEFMLDGSYTFTFTDYVQFNTKNKKNIRCKKVVSRNDLLKNNYILTSTVIYNAKKLGKIYMANIRKRQDWSLFINIIEKSEFAYNLPLALSFYRKHEDSISSNKIDLLKYNFNFYNKVLGYSKLKSFLMMVRFLFHYFIKKIREKFF
ncbi:glycosyltransferase family 2 protein [Maribacter sp. Hel_I_7]|uniref:glycosyltransferase family 2 protein n=1 Tax=Maribacter sp. Hel_I_7 TaxID=1249997 RepID=UPI00047C5B34|nr:glycosyltransferase family 2 protein [Maribacter sp. Hel_I_7]